MSARRNLVFAGRGVPGGKWIFCTINHVRAGSPFIRPGACNSTFFIESDEVGIEVAAASGSVGAGRGADTIGAYRPGTASHWPGSLFGPFVAPADGLRRDGLAGGNSKIQFAANLSIRIAIAADFAGLPGAFTRPFTGGIMY